MVEHWSVDPKVASSNLVIHHLMHPIACFVPQSDAEGSGDM